MVKDDDELFSAMIKENTRDQNNLPSHVTPLARVVRLLCFSLELQVIVGPWTTRWINKLC